MSREMIYFAFEIITIHSHWSNIFSKSFITIWIFSFSLDWIWNLKTIKWFDFNNKTKWLVNTSINGVISEHVSIDGDDNS